MTARVGIVLVSHSAALAEGTAELAGQVGGGTVAIAAAGGTDDGRLGTSIDKVSRAVELANGGAGVVIIPDLGSAVLTVRTLLAELDTDLEAGLEGGGGRPPAGQVVVADAPFVEGTVAAAVTAAAGADLQSVLGAAQSARDARKL
jgi:PTS hybrid protein